MTEPINRWNHGASFEHAFDCDAGMYASAEGQYVTYADHADELRACEKRVIDAAVQRVEALAKEWEEQTLAVQLAIGIALAAIKGDQP